MDRENVWMIQVRGRRGFLFKTMEPILIGGVFLAQNFDGDFAAELHVFRQIDLAHAARAEFFQNPVVGNFGTVQKRKPLIKVPATAVCNNHRMMNATMGEMSIMPTGGITRRSGPSNGSVIFKRKRIIPFVL